jgi:hypothetical protein
MPAKGEAQIDQRRSGMIGGLIQRVFNLDLTTFGLKDQMQNERRGDPYEK